MSIYPELVWAETQSRERKEGRSHLAVFNQWARQQRLRCRQRQLHPIQNNSVVAQTIVHWARPQEPVQSCGYISVWQCVCVCSFVGVCFIVCVLCFGATVSVLWCCSCPWCCCYFCYCCFRYYASSMNIVCRGARLKLPQLSTRGKRSQQRVSIRVCGWSYLRSCVCVCVLANYLAGCVYYMIYRPHREYKQQNVMPN